MNEETTQTTETTTTTTQAAETPVPTAEQVEAAIDTALDEAVASVTETADAGEGGKETDGAGKADADAGAVVKDEGGAGKGKEDAPPAEVDYSEEQALFERGVKAGISVKDMLAVPTHEMAERMVELAEKANGISPNKEDEGDAAGSPDDDFGKAIEEMEKDGEYDPKIVRVLKGLYKENQTLKSAGQTAEREGFFDSQVGKLDEGLRSHMDAVRKSQLKSKYDLLEAGYKAQGAKISREEVFKEAAKLALGDLMDRQTEERKASALEQRKNLTLARPGGERGQYRRGNGPATEEDIASELWDQMTSN